MAEEADDEREEGTEPATPRRIQKACDDGDLPLSREAVAFATLLAASATAALTLPGQVAQFQAALRGALGRAHEWESMAAAREWLHLFLGVLWPVAGAAILAAVAAMLAQTRGVVTLRAFSFDLGKLSPLAGFKRLFGGEAWLELGRTLLKLGGVGAALWLAALGLAQPGGLLEVPAAALFDAAGSGVLRLFAVALGVSFLLALGDVMLTHHRFLWRLRMTRKEVRDEMKDSEGSPEVKGRQRQMRQILERRMLAEVPKAAVVITNPTHYAVALAYEPGQAAAPRVVAKGVDAMAARIREAARGGGAGHARPAPGPRPLPAGT